MTLATAGLPPLTSPSRRRRPVTGVIDLRHPPALLAGALAAHLATAPPVGPVRLVGVARPLPLISGLVHLEGLVSESAVHLLLEGRDHRLEADRAALAEVADRLAGWFDIVATDLQAAPVGSVVRSVDLLADEQVVVVAGRGARRACRAIHADLVPPR